MTAPQASIGTGTETSEGELSTFGWDTAFAVRIENVNAAIRSRKVSPASFRQVSPDDAGTWCAGSFGDWQLVRGGDGDGVNVLLPISDITGQAGGQTSPEPYSCAAVSVTVTIRLQFIDGEANKRHLVVNPAATSDDVPAVELYQVVFTEAPVPSYAGYAIQAALVAWCADHLAEFGYVFAVADLNDEADTGLWAFLKPTEVSYAYVNGASDDDAFLGVLAMTNGRDPSALQQIIDKRIVHAAEEGAFCISRSLLLADLIMPQLLTVWPDIKPSQLTLTENALQLNAGQQVQLPQTEYQGNWYTPQLQEFSFTCEGSQITVEAYTVNDVQSGVQAWCRTTARYTILMGTNKDGQTTLAYQQLGDPDVSHGHYIDSGEEIEDIILSICEAIAFAALAALTDGAAALLILVIGALVSGLIALSPQIMGLIENDDAPAIDLLQDNIYAPMVWTDSKDFSVTSVDLNGSLRLGGALGFG